MANQWKDIIFQSTRDILRMCEEEMMSKKENNTPHTSHLNMVYARMHAMFVDVVSLFFANYA